MDIFQSLGNSNRRNMLKILLHRKMHISALGKELNISTPVALKHVNILEETGLVERQQVGNTHIIEINRSALPKLKKVWSLMEKPLVVEVEKGTPMLDALKKVSGLKIEKSDMGIYISAVDGKEGYYIYEVNGKLPKEAADQYMIKSNCEIGLKRLIPVIGKQIIIKTKGK